MNSQSPRRTIMITGANKGIGYAIVEKLLTRPGPYDIILTSRDSALGEKALKSLQTKHTNSPNKLIYHQLDINDEKSINTFADWFKTNIGKLDVLINNAAVLYRNATATDEEKNFTIQTNFISVTKLTKKLLPLLSDDGKILMISSRGGQLSWQGETLRKALEDPSLNLGKLYEIANNFITVSQDFPENPYMPEPSYPGSKALLNSYVKNVLVKQLKATQQVYSICPGWCRTDMGTEKGMLSAEEGADTPVYLVELPFERNDELHGKLIHERKVEAF